VIADGIHAIPAPRSRVYALLAPLAVFLLLWLWFFAGEGAFKGGPSGKAFEADFAMFVGGAKVLAHAGDPYNPAVLYPAERSMLAAQGLAITTKKAIVRVGNPPLFFWVLGPIAGLPFGAAGLAWGGLLLLVSAAGFLILLNHLGWRHHLVPLLIFLAMPQVFLGAFYGNVVGFVFLSLAASVALARRYPYVAGSVMVVAWLKPPVALPIALLIVLFQSRQRRKVVVGFAAASALALCATVATTGAHSLGMWVGGLIRYSRDVTLEPDISSLAGLYVRNAPVDMRWGLGALALLSAAVLTVVMFRRLSGGPIQPELAAGWLWILWFLATPYAHFFDQILLTLPVLAFLGRDGFLVTRRDQVITLYLIFFSLVFIEWAPHGIQLLSLPLVAIIFALEKASRQARAAEGDATYVM
jgi:hypothetical protein